MNKLSTLPYKGSRDFFPEDMKIRKWMFGVMREVVESFGYEEYDGPIIESLEIYEAKTGEEIVKNQLYHFEDKGGRRVAIRPEMTPTLARMVAAKNRDYSKPIRWYSIPNLWRYERPSKGRLREHWQLNVDLFGADSYLAEVEMIKIAFDILKKFKAPKNSYQIKISHRKILENFLFNTLSLTKENAYQVSKILDKMNKISKEEFETELSKYLSNPETTLPFIYQFLNSDLTSIQNVQGIDTQSILDLNQVFETLKGMGIEDLIFDPSIVRGFDYYTGMIFEVFDTNPDNRRSLYGGGRYDNLIGLFSNENLSGIGFGLGDVTFFDFLEGHNLLPVFEKEKKIFITMMDAKYTLDYFKFADLLKGNGWNTEMYLDPQTKFGKQMGVAEKKKYPYVLIMGEREKEKNIVLIKDLITGNQQEIAIDLLDKFEI